MFAPVLLEQCCCCSSTVVVFDIGEIVAVLYESSTYHGRDISREKREEEIIATLDSYICVVLQLDRCVAVFVCDT